MARTSPTEFVTVARALQEEARRLGLVVPAFRSRPHRGTRAIRRCPDGIVVLVATDRDVHAVTEDLIDGVLAAQNLDAEDLDWARTALWDAAGIALVTEGAA